MEPPANMEHSSTHTDGTASEQASGPAAAFQDEMESWTDRVGYGAYRGLICGLFTAWGFAFLHGIFLIVYFLTAYNRDTSDYDTSMMDYVELGFHVVKENGIYLIIFWSLLIVPAGLIVGAILGAVGIIRKKKCPSEPEKPESN